MKIKFVGTLSQKEATELLAFEGLEKMFKSLNLSLPADICRQIFEIAADYDGLIPYTKDAEDSSREFPIISDEISENKIYIVGKAQICKGTTIRCFKILKDSYIATPRPSLARNIRDVYDLWLSEGIIEDDGRLTQDMEVNSRNIAVGLALGYSANANSYIPKEDDWK